MKITDGGRCRERDRERRGQTERADRGTENRRGQKERKEDPCCNMRDEANVTELAPG